MDEVREISDVLLVFDKETGETIAKTIEMWLRNKGYTVVMASEDQLERLSDLALSATVVFFLCTSAVLDSSTPLTDWMLTIKDKRVIPIWPNNCKPWAWPKKVSDDIVALRNLEPSTLDMIGTDFELSLDKACARFPDELRKKNAIIREYIAKGNWGALLLEHPELIDLCDTSAITANDWIDILDRYPNMVNICRWGEFSGWDWRVLFRRHPEFATYCDWSVLNGGDWAEVLSKYPELSDHCDWEKLSGMDWAGLLSTQPQFAEYCDKWLYFSGRDWVELLVSQPHLADRCEQQAWLALDGGHWADLLSRRPEFDERCGWRWRLLSGRDWVKLLGVRPELSSHCNFKALDAHDWVSLLKRCPQFADYCDFNVFDGGDWVNLLARNGIAQALTGILTGKDDIVFLKARPEFARYCNWNTLDGGNWAELLSLHPEFSGHCDWGLFTEDDWDSLLRSKPEFKKYRPEKRRRVAVVKKPATVRKPVDSIAPKFDIFIACDNSCGEDVADRLSEALMKRGYAVYVGEDDINEGALAAIEASKYFMLIRTAGLYDKLANEQSVLRAYLLHALESGCVVIPIGPSDRPWGESRQIPSEFIAIDTLQVKNLDMGNLFGEKVDAIINDCMKGNIGELNKQYDMFISYRRNTGADTARLLQQQFKALGYTVFLDYDSIRNGKYDKVILSALNSVQVFIMVLTERSLDRCVDPNDWVTAEIVRAIELKKCIVPITPNVKLFTEPPVWPKSLEAVRKMPILRVEVEGSKLKSAVSEIEACFPEELRKKNADIRSMMDAGEWGDLMIAHPDLEAICEWDAIKDHDWSRLLAAHPQFADRCDWEKIGKYKPWGLGSYHSDWVDLLKAQPQLARFCDLSSLTPSDKAEVLSHFPLLGEQDEWGGLCERTHEGIIHWVHVLEQQPQFADKCEFERFKGKDWSYLLIEQPQFADRCDWSTFEGSDWVRLLRHRPEFVEKCDWGTLHGKDLCEIIEDFPEILKDCSWDMISGESWVGVLTKHPEYADKCDWDMLEGEAWEALLTERPEFACHCEQLAHIREMIAEAETIDSGDEYGFDVGMLLWLWPEFIHKVESRCLSQINNMVWINLLGRDERIAEYCNWDAFSDIELAAILMQHPQYANRCDWSKIKGELKDELLREHPELANYGK